MTNKEKFYKLAMNVINDKHKVIKYVDGQISNITVSNSRNEIYFKCTPIRCFQFYVFVRDEVPVTVDEDDPSNIDELIGYIKKYFQYRENILDGLE